MCFSSYIAFWGLNIVTIKKKCDEKNKIINVDIYINDTSAKLYSFESRLINNDRA